MKNTVLDIKNYKSNTKFYLALGLSLLFFLQKGIMYAFISSYLPLALILVVITLLIYGKSKPLKNYKRIIKLWSILLIIWSFFRILMAIIIWFIKPISESHINEQLGIFGFSLSVLILFLGVYLFRKSKFLYKKANSN